MVEDFWIELSYRYSIPYPYIKKHITSDAFNILFARECINPSGESRADFRSAIVAVTMAKSFGNKTAKISEFMPKFGHSKEVESPQEIRMKLRLLQNMINRAGK